MGHTGVKGLLLAVEGINFNNSNKKSCQICAKANIKRNPFPQCATHPATHLLQCIHCDICGPLPPLYSGFCYFILFICCHSCYIFISLMKSRDHAPDHFIQFKSLAETFSQQKISILRVDNVPELVRSKLEEHCKSFSISYEKTIPDTPNQNGVAKRCNLTLASRARALLLNAGLTEWYWPFAILTAIHLKNRIPHSNLPAHKTPFEYWYQYKPNLSHLCLFGTPCTARIIFNTLSKFNPHSESGRFLGYAQDAKGYLVWVPNPSGPGGTVKTRRDVVFHDFPSPPPPNNPLPLWDEITPSKQPNNITAYISTIADTLPLFNDSQNVLANVHLTPQSPSTTCLL